MPRKYVLIMAAVLLFSGCRKQTEEKEENWKQEMTTLEETPTDAERVTFPVLTEEQIYSYSNEVVTWGPGIQRGEDNRPVAPVAFAEKYKNFQAEFIKEKEKVIYLTFDEGYENGYTAKILDVLKKQEVSAVFFVTMPYAKTETDLLTRMIAENHVIGNHSVTHPAKGMPSLSIEQQREEYQKLHQYVKDTYGYEMYLFRPPAGIFSEQSLAVAQSCGYRTVLWSFAYADWDPDKQPAREEALQKLKDRLHEGAIYLLHAVSKTNTEILEEFIVYAKEQGYTFRKYE